MHISWPMGIEAGVLRYHLYCGSNAKTLAQIWTAVLTYASSSVNPRSVELVTNAHQVNVVGFSHDSGIYFHPWTYLLDGAY